MVTGVGEMAFIHGVVFDCADPELLANFWLAALDWEYRTFKPEEDWITIQPKGGDQAMSLGFGTVPEGKVVKNRVHLDLRPMPGVTWEEEQARLEALGATHLWTIEDYHVVLADPEGNEFCLLNPKYYPPADVEVLTHGDS
jgi:hypothetical protein